MFFGILLSSTHCCFLRADEVSVISSVFQQRVMERFAQHFLRECYTEGKLAAIYDKNLCTCFDDIIIGNFQNACSWKGVECRGGSLVSFSWTNNEPFPDGVSGALCLDWLPSTVKTFELQSAGQNAPLALRSLPRSMQTLCINHNQYYGDLDLGDSPTNFETFEAEGNDFSGLLLLRSIPAAMRTLNLANNELRKVIVNNSDIPSCMQSILLSHNPAIKRRNILVCDGKQPDRRILV